MLRIVSHIIIQVETREAKQRSRHSRQIELHSRAKQHGNSWLTPTYRKMAKVKSTIHIEFEMVLIIFSHDDLVHYSTLNTYLNYFVPMTIRLWNSLPHKTKSSNSLTSFKTYSKEIAFKSFYRV